MFSTLTLAIRIKIATYAPKLIFCCSDLYRVKNRIVCPFHKHCIIYVNCPCRTCGFVKRLSQQKLDKLHDYYRRRRKRRKFKHSET